MRQLHCCMQVWRPYTIRDVDAIEGVQKRYTEIVDGCKDESCERGLEKLNVASMADGHCGADVMQVCGMLDDESNIYPIGFLELSEEPGGKNSLGLFKRRSGLDVKKCSFASRVVDLWS